MELLNYLFCDMFGGILECYELTHVLPQPDSTRQSCMSGHCCPACRTYYFDRNKILSGYDLSHYQVPHCIKSFLLFCLICVYSSQFSILFQIMYLL